MKNKSRREEVPETDIDVAKRCAEMEKDRWGEGERERNGGWPDGTLLSNF